MTVSSILFQAVFSGMLQNSLLQFQISQDIVLAKLERKHGENEILCISYANKNQIVVLYQTYEIAYSIV